MKIKKANAGALTNFEVLNFLRSRGAATDPTRVIAPVASSEYQVYDYLVESAACNQTQESIHEFLKRCEKYKLAKAEKLNIINIRPSTLVEIDPIIEECQKRLSEEEVEELVEMIVSILPSPPKSVSTDEGEEEIPDGSKMETTDEGEGIPNGSIIYEKDEVKEGISDGSTLQDTNEGKEGIRDESTMEEAN